MFGISSNSPPSSPSPTIGRCTEGQYTKAFNGILTPEELENLDDQKCSVIDTLMREILVKPRIVRFISDKLSFDQKIKFLLERVKKLEKSNTKPDDNKLNNITLFLFDDENSLKHNDKYQKIPDFFPKNKENEWPILAITSNSNLVSPQVFFDGFEAARKLIPHITDEHKNEKIIVMGTYFSKNDALSNACETLNRIKHLKKNQDNIQDYISPAARIQARQLLSFLIERDKEGNVVTKPEIIRDEHGEIIKEKNRLLLRDDADKIMKRIVGYGYSGGHLTNKDSFRILRHTLKQGHLMVKYVNGSTIYRPSSEADAQKILTNARLIGIAGADGFYEVDRNMPREINFLSPHDRIASAHGNKFKNPYITTEIIPPKINLLTLNPVSDHAQSLYVEALLAEKNHEAIKAARKKLLQAPQTSTLRPNPDRQQSPRQR